jgi:thiamine-phosphate pyrophosphorylase
MTERHRKNARAAGLRAFYPILPDAAWIERLVPLGIGTVQLRVKCSDTAAIRRQIERSSEVCASHRCLLVVNDHWREALATGAAAVHLGQEDLVEADLPPLKARGIAVGISTHDEAELDIAIRAGADMVALGPIFPPRGKAVDHAPQGMSRLMDWRRRLGDMPLIAIGGLTLETASAAVRAGADAVAVITDVTAAADPEARVRAWLAWQASVEE